MPKKKVKLTFREDNGNVPSRKSKVKKKVISPSNYIDTGSTLLNLALSDNVRGGFLIGRVHNLVGDSSSGKTFVALTSLACTATTNKSTKLVFDDAESADSFNKEHLFGSTIAKKIQSPYRYAKKKSSKTKTKVYDRSHTLEEFELHIFTTLNDSKKFYYVLDSFDSISDKAELEVAQKNRDAIEKDKDTKGSYGMSKQRGMSSLLRRLVGHLAQAHSTLLIISQTRANISPMSFAPKTRSGGKALKFYSTTEIWMVEAGKITKTVNGKTVAIGINAKAKITKNKVTGKYREVTFPIYYSYGIDDIGSCVDYLVAMKTWKKSSNSILVPKWKFKGTREKLITYIETNDKYEALRDVVQKTWDGFEDKVSIKRKPRFQ